MKRIGGSRSHTAGRGTGSAAAPKRSSAEGACSGRASKRCCNRYLVVLDFEATCQKVGRISPQEIIEFPSVVYDTQAGKVVDMYQDYIKPVHNPVLTGFCTELTGITQSTVDEGKSFPQAMSDYDGWMQRNGYADDCLVVTCGDWDLKTMLPAQCRLHTPAVVSPPYLRKWLNIKTAFSALTNRKARGMAAMLKSLALPLVGRHHSGIDDCRNIASILHALLALPGASRAITVSRAL